MNFEWDDIKAKSNEVKHKLSFDLAVRVFLDANCLILDTTRIEDEEDRMKAIGIVDRRLLTIIFTKRNSVIRIISARPSNTKEKTQYGDR
jgi:uncharacterized protein